MKKNLLLFFILLCLHGICSAQFSARPADVIDTELRELLEQKNDEMISVNIILKSQMDQKVLNNYASKATDKESKRQVVINELKRFSKETQHDLISILQAEEKSSNVTNIKSHWITNYINCTASADVIYKLSEHPDIKIIIHNKMEKLTWDEKPIDAEAFRGMTENITKVNADDVWNLGYTGEGVIVSVLDTGVNYNHVDLKDHLWNGGAQYPYHGYDFVNNDNNPMDDDSHGTHCAGTICGDGTSGTQTGMAPDATLMCVKVLGPNGGTFDMLSSGVEFSLDNGADILSLSLGWTYPDAEISNSLRNVFNNVLEAGVVAAVAAGNERDEINLYPIPRNVGSPGNCPPPWLHPDQQANAGGLSSVVCVGAVDYSDNPASFSSEGPVTWQETSYNDYQYVMAPSTSGWLYYDNGIFNNSIGGPSTFYWGIKLTPEKLANYNGKNLSKVSVYDYVATTGGSIYIYQGGENAPNTLIHSQSYSTTGANAFVDYLLTSEITIDATQPLWIIMSTVQGDNYPAAGSNDTGDPNGRWLSTDGSMWADVKDDIGLPYTWMIRAYVETDDTEVVENTNFGLVRPDVSAPGVGIISASHTSNNGFVTMSGTSMATPCVAGVMALMLEKDPDLTPADICRILETTAVKLSDKKNNRTGSGRIDALAALNKVGVDYYTFVGDGNKNLWTTASNWRDPNGMTMTEMVDLSDKEVVIDGNAIIAEGDNITAEFITINHGKSIEVENGATLTINNKVTNSDHDALIFNDGAQIFTNENDIVSTFVKNIANPETWSEDHDKGWQFIASPLSNTPITDFIPTTSDYDLFKYDNDAELQWYNYKNHIPNNESYFYNFDNNMEGWTTIDSDGDGYCWEYYQGYAKSASYINGSGPLTPDNYLVSPLKISVNNNCTISFQACALDAIYPEEHFGVAISTEGNTSASDFNTIAEWTLSAKNNRELGSWYKYTVDLSSYIGQDIWVAIRHFNCYDKFSILVNDISIVSYDNDSFEESFQQGTGYLASYETETTANLKGTINNSTNVEFPITYNADNHWSNFHLIGNPFSFDISWNNFTKHNVVDGIAKINTDGTYNYNIINDIKVGEGFMIKTSGENPSLTYNIDSRSNDDADNYRYINVMASGDEGSENVIVNFSDNKEEGFPKLDNINEKAANLYLLENNYRYGINTYNNDIKKIPLYFDAKEIGYHTITIMTEGEFDYVHLIDMMTGEDVDMLLEGEYDFLARTNDRADRFILMLDANDVNSNSDYSNFAYINNDELIVTGIEGETTINIFDMSGRCIYKCNTSDATNIISTNAFRSSVFVIQKIDDNGIKVQKIVVY